MEIEISWLTLLAPLIFEEKEAAVREAGWLFTVHRRFIGSGLSCGKRPSRKHDVTQAFSDRSSCCRRPIGSGRS